MFTGADVLWELNGKDLDSVEMLVHELHESPQRRWDLIGDEDATYACGLEVLAYAIPEGRWIKLTATKKLG